MAELFTSIVAALDLAETTPRVLKTASALAKSTAARLHVVHSIELEYAGDQPPPPTFAALCEAAQARLEQALKQSTGIIEVASRHVLFHAAHRTIVVRAARVRADLIVIGPHRRRRRLAIGSTTDRVLRTAPCACWIARRRLRLPLTRVVATVDFSPAGRAAVELAARIAAQLGRHEPPAELSLMHVANPANGEERIEEAKHRLDESAAQLGERYALNIRPRVIRGLNAAHAILADIDERPPDLLVTGSHGYGRLGRILLGSVSQRLASDARCDVLVVPPERRRSAKG